MRVTKTVVGFFIFIAHNSMLPTIAAAARSARRRTNILVWHDLVPDGQKLVWFDTEESEFARQLDTLERVGIMPVPLDTVYEYLRTGRNAPPVHAAVLCFDDNTAGIFDYVFPELTRRGYPFAVSAHTKYVGVRTSKRHCTWEQLREMEASGLARVVSQTHTHPPDLRTLSDTALRREMWESKIRHEENLGRTARFLTYPSGKWDRRVALAANDAGYRLGLTEDHGAAESSPYLLGLHRWSTHKRFADAVSAVRTG